MQVNAETLQEKVKWLEIYKARMNISLNEEYQLEAYKMLQKLIEGTVQCQCNCRFWHYDEFRERRACNGCLGVKAHD